MQKLSFTRAFVMDTVVYKQNTKKEINENNQKERKKWNKFSLHTYRCELLPVYLSLCIFFFRWNFFHDWNVWRHMHTRSGYGLIYRSEFAYMVGAKFFELQLQNCEKLITKALITLEAICVPDHSLLSFLFGRNEINGAIEKKSRI